MLVRDPPLAVNLAEANGRAPPHIELSSVFTGCANMAEAVREGQVIARSDIEIANLLANRTLENITSLSFLLSPSCVRAQN